MLSIPHNRLAIPLLLLFGGVFPLGFALFTQYGLGLPPCHYCLLQRYPYALPILAGLLAWLPALAPRLRLLLLVGMLGWCATAAIGLYHVGIEQGWIIEQGGCSASALTGSVEDIRAQIMGAPIVACNNSIASFLGLSMAAWNVIGALGLCATGAYLWRKQGATA